MKDYYSKNDFWVRKNEDSDERKYYIRLNGMYIEVSKDVFDTCYYSYYSRTLYLAVKKR